MTSNTIAAQRNTGGPVDFRCLGCGRRTSRVRPVSIGWMCERCEELRRARRSFLAGLWTGVIVTGLAVLLLVGLVLYVGVG